jgi:AraC-like DNA-binding protein
MLVQEAKAVLKYTDASIAEIAYQLNFSEPASFNRFFKKMTGETPLVFRKHA